MDSDDDGVFAFRSEDPWDMENFGNDGRITFDTRRSLQQYRDYFRSQSYHQSISDGFLFCDGRSALDSDRPVTNNAESVFPRTGHSQINFKPQFYIHEESSRNGPQDLRVFDFVDSTKQLIQKGWNSKLFRRHKLATYNWSFKAPMPLMDSRYFYQVPMKDVLKPGTDGTSALIAGRSIFTPKYGVTARDTLRENAGILFFTKDIDFDYQASLCQLSQLYPNLVSCRYYVPFLTFVQALRRTRVERMSPRRVSTGSLVLGLLWLIVAGALLQFTWTLSRDRLNAPLDSSTVNSALWLMILAPVLTFILGFCH